MEVGVSFSVYDITVPVMVLGLNVMDDHLDHVQALEETRERLALERVPDRVADADKVHLDLRAEMRVARR